jgi:hypothetical protein
METREDTGYTSTESDTKRVPFRDYGNKARAEKAKKELKETLKQLQIESEKLKEEANRY